MISFRIFAGLILLLAIATPQFAQQPGPSTTSKKAEKLFFSAIEAYQARNYEKALEDLEKAVTADPRFIDAFILQGDIYSDLRETGKAIQSYENAIRTNHPFNPSLYLILANLQLSQGFYREAKLNFERAAESPNLTPARRQQAEQGISACFFAIRMMADPVPFSPVNLGDSINSLFDEYINAISSDGEWLYFTRKNPKNAQTVDQSRAFEEDFYHSHKADSGWRLARNLGPPINSHGNEGALSISPDGKYLFFAACNRDDGYGSCDIYWSRREGTRWSSPVNLGGTVNSNQWDSQPSFSSDGKTLYFASKRGGGKGSSDIWKTTLGADGSWSTPVNLGDSINTKAEEMAPFIHPDDQTLYFSSKGHQGMGGLDLFFARKGAGGNWSSPVNLGFPINTHADEITLVVDARGDLAFISSDVFGGKGRQDVYMFPLYKEARPVLTTYFKGIVFDEKTSRRLEARFELTDLELSKVVAESSSDPVTGDFLLVLPTNREYGLNVSKEGYLFYSEHFSLTGTNTSARPFIKDIPLKPIRIGETVVLKNIFFDTDKFDLKTESRMELDKLTDLLKKNPKMQIEISGHTDNVGTAEHNQALSANRALAVYNYLAGQGVPAGRLSYKGYGFSQPIDTNETEEGRANNRRTEFKVVGN